MRVKRLLGHKRINANVIYITIEKRMFRYAEHEYVSRAAKTVEEAQKLVDVGFEYVCDFGADGKIFRKRK